MRKIAAFLMTALLLATAPVHAQNPNLNGTWVISMKDSGIEFQTDRLKKFRIFDPGIGWPEELSSQESVVAGMLMGEMPIGEMPALTLQIVQKGNELRVTRSFTIGGKKQTVSQRFTLDGTRNENPASTGKGRLVSWGNWENGLFVVLGVQTDGAREIVVKEEYRLIDGKLVLRASGYYRSAAASGRSPSEVAQKPSDVTITQTFEKQG